MDSAPSWLPRLAAYCAELESALSVDALAEIKKRAHGRPLAELRHSLVNATDPAAIQAVAELLAANENGCTCSGDPAPEPSASQIEAAADRLAREALAPFVRNRSLNDYFRALGLEMPALSSEGLSPT